MRVPSSSLCHSLLVLALAGCAADGSGGAYGGLLDASTPDVAIDGGAHPVDAASSVDGGPSGDATVAPDAAVSSPGPDASPPDAFPPVDLDAGTTVVVLQPVSGTPAPTTTPLHGPGLVLMGGGTDVDAAFVWMHDTVAGSPTAHGGNLVVLRADSNTDNAYTPYIYALAPFQSVMTLFLGGSSINGTPATQADLAIAAHYVSQADAVFFAGGDQADYVSWKGSVLMQAVAAVYARGGVVGGTSAGCAILGPFVFDSVAADQAGGSNVATADAVNDPFESTISFTRGMLTFPTVPRVITDMHFVTRDRLGRLAAFVARQYADGAATSDVLGVGVDESNALLVDGTGKAKLVQQSGGSEASTGTGAYVLQPAAAADTCSSGQPLLYKSVKVTRIADPATDGFDFAARCGTGVTFTLTVDGSTSKSPYSPDPYGTAGTATACL
jgi:cyanophycinase